MKKPLGLLLLVFYAAYPIGFRLTSIVRRNALFLPFVNWPMGVNFSSPHVYVNATRNFYIQSEEGVSIGVWHILPHSLMNASYDNDGYEKSLSDGFPIILYLHGITGSRINGHRLELYKKLQALDYHVIAFDYRGYADSVSEIPLSENGVVTDAKAAYAYIKKYSANSKVIVWGHSLGTGVASRAVSELSVENDVPHGMLLESPFNTFPDAVLNIPWTWIYRPVSYMLPVFHWFFIEPMREDDNVFESERHIRNIPCPILILHAQDDKIVPLFLAQKLYESALDGRPKEWPSVQFVEFHQSLGYGHKDIFLAEDLPSILQEFLEWKAIGTSEIRLIS